KRANLTTLAVMPAGARNAPQMRQIRTVCRKKRKGAATCRRKPRRKHFPSQRRFLSRLKISFMELGHLWRRHSRLNLPASHRRPPHALFIYANPLCFFIWSFSALQLMFPFSDAPCGLCASRNRGGAAAMLFPRPPVTGDARTTGGCDEIEPNSKIDGVF